MAVISKGTLAARALSMRRRISERSGAGGNLVDALGIRRSSSLEGDRERAADHAERSSASGRWV